MASNSLNSFLSGLFGADGFIQQAFGFVGNHVNSWLNSQTGAGLTGSEMAHMAFDEKMAKDARADAHQEAVDARAWQTEMSNTTYQRGVQDMQAAGINPAMMYGGTAVSNAAPSASLPSAPSASSGAPSKGALDVGSLMQIAFSKAQVDLMKSEARLNNSKADEALSNIDVNSASLDEISNRCEYWSSEVSKNYSYRELIDQQAVQQRIDNMTREESNRVKIDLDKAYKAMSDAKTDTEAQNAKLGALQVMFQNGLLSRGFIDQYIRNFESGTKLNLSVSERNRVAAYCENQLLGHHMRELDSNTNLNNARILESAQNVQESKSRESLNDSKRTAQDYINRNTASRYGFTGMDSNSKTDQVAGTILNAMMNMVDTFKPDFVFKQ